MARSSLIVIWQEQISPVFVLIISIGFSLPDFSEEFLFATDPDPTGLQVDYVKGAGKLAAVILENYSQIHAENHAHALLAIKPHEARVKLQDSVTKILNQQRESLSVDKQSTLGRSQSTRGRKRELLDRTPGCALLAKSTGLGVIHEWVLIPVQTCVRCVTHGVSLLHFSLGPPCMELAVSPCAALP